MNPFITKLFASFGLTIGMAMVHNLLSDPPDTIPGRSAFFAFFALVFTFWGLSWILDDK